jgi:tetratricopeptide (TPR) repeat protein
MSTINAFYRSTAVLLAVVLCALPLPTRAGSGGQSSAEDIDPVGLTALYSLDFDVAEERFRIWTERNPTNPMAWNMLASSIWLRVVYEQEKLNLETFDGSKLGGEDSEDAISPEREAEFRATLDRAKSAAQAIVDEDPNDIDALYALGVAHGTTAAFEALVKRSLRAANGEAKKAKDLHLRVLELDASYSDAHVSIGTYDYTVGALPFAIKLLIAIVGIRGDKDGGLERLEIAAGHGRNEGVNAKMVLVVAYNREKEYDKSLGILLDLHAQYPRNFLIEVSIGSVYQRMEDWDNAIRTYRSVLEKARSGRDGYDRLEPEPVLFRVGEAYMHAGRYEDGRRTFLELVAIPGVEDELESRTRLWLGKIFDSEGRRADALEQYDRILELDAPEDIANEATRYRRRPYSG